MATFKQSRIVEAESSPYRDSETKINLLETEKRWIKCIIIFVTFEENPEHSSHMNVLINPTYYVDHLISIISGEKHFECDSIQLYRNNTLSADMKLPRHLTFEQCGFRGGDYYRPKEIKLFYDLQLRIIDCPLLTNTEL